ncbi:hypothetical protein BBF96_03270 [Anoxybacter fermentans]|uniref:Uncharacterized protein n=1 Tax=Anoxybacter fermentans TaxID=1323375 RepID=A0A3S9SW36_9FIRM|nr:hypothetical protein [Anoxybacter fermentans]AZR72485.1 hypothetical protein BBF96_03270 [Anoxybacter fermentans]
MKQKFLPLFIKVDFRLDIIKLRELDENIFTKIKNKYGFNTLEINKDEVILRGGFPMFSCIFSEESIQIVTFTSDIQTAIDSIIDLVNQINILAEIEIQYISYIEIANLLKFQDNKDLFGFFVNCKDYSDGVEISGAYLTLDTIDGKKNIKYIFKFEDEKGFSAIALKALLNFKDDIELKGLLEHNIKYLQEKMTYFLSTRSGKFLLGVGVNKIEQKR